MSSKHIITRTIWTLSIVSLCTDIASEMLYPVMPIYLKYIGFSIVLIGIFEGIAEATAWLSKTYFGRLSDNSGKRTPFIRTGYFLSAISRPLMILFISPLWVFFMRTIDKFGKWIRTGARDALLSDEATPATKGTVFGFHRGMDTLGAVIWPTLALIFLLYFPEQYRMLFLLAFIPGVLAVALSFLLREKKKTIKQVKKTTSFFSSFSYWKESPALYRKVLVWLLIFTLFNSSDVFLLLRIKEAGWNDTWVIGSYVFYNLIYAILSYPIGVFADKIGLKNTFVFGLSIFALVYFGMAFQLNIYLYMGLFALYGLYSASTEWIVKAWISNITEEKDTATALGMYTGFQSICTLGASTLAGLIWFYFWASTTFLVTSFVTVGVVIYFIMFTPENPTRVPR